MKKIDKIFEKYFEMQFTDNIEAKNEIKALFKEQEDQFNRSAKNFAKQIKSVLEHDAYMVMNAETVLEQLKIIEDVLDLPKVLEHKGGDTVYLNFPIDNIKRACEIMKRGYQWKTLKK